MATLTRSAKSGRKWAPNDLRAFNIQVVLQDAFSFFNLQELPVPQNIPPVIWNSVTPPPAAQLSKMERHFFGYLEDAVTMPPEEESLVKDFVVFLLGLLDYDAGSRIVHTQKEMPFYMCGSRVDAKVDVTVVERDPFFQYVLLVQEDKRYQSGDDPEPGLIAEAIAAFYHNKRARKISRLPLVESQTFPAITIVGTAATFYKITVTQDLLFAVQTGQFPTNATVIHRFVPCVPDIGNYPSKGMIPLENRRIVLQCFEAFKQFMVVP